MLSKIGQRCEDAIDMEAELEPPQEAVRLARTVEPRSAWLVSVIGFLLLGFAALLCLTGSQGVASASRRLEQDPFGIELTGKTFKATFAEYGIWGLLNAVVALVYAFVYKQKVVGKIQPMSEHRPGRGNDDFDVGLFDCLSNINYCCMSLWCPEVRQAHTNDVASVFTYWPSLVAMVIARVCCISCGVPCCLNVWFRMHLKDQLGIEDHCINDFVIAILCWPCAVGQQAMAIDRHLGYAVGCCCKVVPLGERGKLLQEHIDGREEREEDS